ncbi:MAG: hypothetical protein IJE21_07550 [Alistipes sp.]|nr:hypothetical protein [Alistipes sp.]
MVAIFDEIRRKGAKNAHKTNRGAKKRGEKREKIAAKKRGEKITTKTNKIKSKNISNFLTY